MAWSKESRHKRGYGGEWEKTRKLILARDCYLCQTCKRSRIITTANIVDHILCKAHGGKDNHDNLEVICKTHHDKKSIVEQGKQQKIKVSIGFDGWPI